jgi:hypothetical protein
MLYNVINCATMRKKSTIKGAGAEGPEATGELGNESMTAGPGRPLEGGPEAWRARAEALGLEPGEQVWELHVVQGRSVGETATLLGLTWAEAAALRQDMRAQRAEHAPRAEADFHAVREELRDRLVSILEDASRAQDDPRLLAVRQRVCDQIADLYGLNMQRRAAVEEAVIPYSQSTPLNPELAQALEGHTLEKYGRKDDVQEAIQGQSLAGIVAPLATVSAA